jgi:hypothetical protein
VRSRSTACTTVEQDGSALTLQVRVPERETNAAGAASIERVDRAGTPQRKRVPVAYRTLMQ